MYAFVRHVRRLVPCVLLGAALCGCETEGSKSPELMDRCYQMYRLWARYESSNGVNHNGQRARAELALYDCQRGYFDRGFQELERILRRDLIPIPPKKVP